MEEIKIFIGSEAEATDDTGGSECLHAQEEGKHDDDKPVKCGVARKDLTE